VEKGAGWLWLWLGAGVRDYWVDGRWFGLLGVGERDENKTRE